MPEQEVLVETLADLLREGEWVTPHEWYRRANAHAKEKHQATKLFSVREFADEVRTLLDVGFVDCHHEFEEGGQGDIIKVTYRKTQS